MVKSTTERGVDAVRREVWESPVVLGLPVSFEHEEENEPASWLK
jgi:hypothetical protein